MNLHPVQSREVVVAAGTSGEHRFTTAQAGDQRVDVGGRYLGVRLQPGTQVDVEPGMQRVCEEPSYAWPWHEGRVVR